jgi:hypothetical protein
MEGKIMETRPLVYSKEADAVGFMVAMNFMDNTVSFESPDGGKAHIASLSEAVVMHSFGEDPEGTPLFDGDIFESRVSGNLYEAELTNVGYLQFHQVDESLERLVAVDRFTVPQFLEMMKNANTYEVLGNKYELEIEEEQKKESAGGNFDFDVKVVKVSLDGGYSYLYACNNKIKKEIDLMTVVFVGSHLTKGQYDRETLTYEQFERLFDEDVYTVADPRELHEFAMEMLNQTSNKQKCDDCDCDSPDDCVKEANTPKDYADDGCGDCDTEDYCEECDQPEDECECELWKRKRK